MNKEKIAVIGGGVMGRGIALQLAMFNYSVLLIDNQDNALQQAKKHIPDDLRLAKMMLPSLREKQIEKILEAITFTRNISAVKEAGMIIENIPENWELKRSLYHQLDTLVRKDSIIAINTSCIPITQIAGCLSVPGRVVGAHFMNPVPLKEIVEIVKGYHTTDMTIDRLKYFLATIGKKSIIVNDVPGFVANRLSHLFMNEAAFLIQDQVATAADIDLMFTKGYGHTMGPLATADLIGLDTVVNSLEILYNNFQDPKFRCCPLLKKMVHAGLLGRKSGYGFYKY